MFLLQHVETSEALLCWYFTDLLADSGWGTGFLDHSVDAEITNSYERSKQRFCFNM